LRLRDAPTQSDIAVVDAFVADALTTTPTAQAHELLLQIAQDERFPWTIALGRALQNGTQDRITQGRIGHIIANRMTQPNTPDTLAILAHSMSQVPDGLYQSHLRTLQRLLEDPDNIGPLSPVLGRIARENTRGYETLTAAYDSLVQKIIQERRKPDPRRYDALHHLVYTLCIEMPPHYNRRQPIWPATYYLTSLSEPQITPGILALLARLPLRRSELVQIIGAGVASEGRDAAFALYDAFDADGSADVCQ